MCTLKSIGLAFNYLSYQPSNFPYLGFKKHSYYMQQIFFCTYGWRRLKLLLHLFIWFAESDHYICASMLSGFESSFSELWDMVKLKILWLHDNVVVFECLLVDWRDTNTSYYCVILPSYLVYWVYSAPFIFHSLIVIISSLVTGSPPSLWINDFIFVWEDSCIPWKQRIRKRNITTWDIFIWVLRTCGTSMDQHPFLLWSQKGKKNVRQFTRQQSRNLLHMH